MNHHSSLSKLQNLFQDGVLHDGHPLSTTWISVCGRATPETQLTIYSHAYKARLKEVLSNDFPAMQMAIGDDHFDELAVDYIKAYPSHYYSLREFGKDMPDFLLQLIQEDEAYQNNYWLYELSTFEWALGQSFDAADATVFTEQDMAAIAPETWPDLKFKMHPSVQCINFEWNTPQLWQALTSDSPTDINAEQQDRSPWLFWRENLVTRYRSITPDEQLALDILLDGKSFNDICEALASIMSDEQVPMQAASYLKNWISQGLINGIQQ